MEKRKRSWDSNINGLVTQHLEVPDDADLRNVLADALEEWGCDAAALTQYRNGAFDPQDGKKLSNRAAKQSLRILAEECMASGSNDTLHLGFLADVLETIAYRGRDEASKVDRERARVIRQHLDGKPVEVSDKMFEAWYPQLREACRELSDVERGDTIYERLLSCLKDGCSSGVVSHIHFLGDENNDLSYNVRDLGSAAILLRLEKAQPDMIRRAFGGLRGVQFENGAHPTTLHNFLTSPLARNLESLRVENVSINQGKWWGALTSEDEKSPKPRQLTVFKINDCEFADAGMEALVKAPAFQGVRDLAIDGQFTMDGLNTLLKSDLAGKLRRLYLRSGSRSLPEAQMGIAIAECGSLENLEVLEIPDAEGARWEVAHSTALRSLREVGDWRPEIAEFSGQYEQALIEFIRAPEQFGDLMPLPGLRTIRNLNDEFVTRLEDIGLEGELPPQAGHCKTLKELQDCALEVEKSLESPPQATMPGPPAVRELKSKREK